MGAKKYLMTFSISVSVSSKIGSVVQHELWTEKNVRIYNITVPNAYEKYRIINDNRFYVTIIDWKEKKIQTIRQNEIDSRTSTVVIAVIIITIIF